MLYSYAYYDLPDNPVHVEISVIFTSEQFIAQSLLQRFSVNAKGGMCFHCSVRKERAVGYMKKVSWGSYHLQRNSNIRALNLIRTIIPSTKRRAYGPMLLYNVSRDSMHCLWVHKEFLLWFGPKFTTLLMFLQQDVGHWVSSRCINRVDSLDE